MRSYEVLVTALKQNDDDRALILRLFKAAGRAVRTALISAHPASEKLWLSDTGEKPGKGLTGPVEVPARGVLTLRAEWRPWAPRASPLSPVSNSGSFWTYGFYSVDKTTRGVNDHPYGAKA